MNLNLWKKRPAVLPSSPLSGELVRLRDEMEHVLNRFFADPVGPAAIDPRGFAFEGWAPAVDVTETDAEVTIRTEVPGIAAKDLDISIAGSTLTIAGEKEEKNETKDGGYSWRERRFGSFRRCIELPDGADTGKISAESDNGVVTIHVPRKPGAQPKQIEIKPVGAPKKVPVAS